MIRVETIDGKIVTHNENYIEVTDDGELIIREDYGCPIIAIYAKGCWGYAIPNKEVNDG